MSDDESGSSGDGSTADRAAAWAARKAAMLASRKAAQKTARREAYQKAKQRRASDPRVLQLKQVAKARRREQAERLKEQRRAVKAAEKSVEKASRSQQRSQAEEELRSFYEQGRARLSPEELVGLQLQALLTGEPSVYDAESLQAPAFRRGEPLLEQENRLQETRLQERLQSSAVVANDIGE